MVFFFLFYLTFIFIVVFPIRFSFDGYFDNKTKHIAFSIKFSFFEKVFGDKNKAASNENKEKKSHFFSLPVKPWLLPFSVLKRITIKLTLPPQNAEIMTYLTMSKALGSFLPFEIIYFFGKKLYVEISAKISVNLFELFPTIRKILQERRKNGNNVIT